MSTRSLTVSKSPGIKPSIAPGLPSTPSRRSRAQQDASTASTSSSTMRIRRPRPPAPTGTSFSENCVMGRSSKGAWASFAVTGFRGCESRATCSRCWRRRPLQMAPARWDEDRGVRVERVPVGHPGDVVGNSALDAIALCDPLVLGREDLGTLFEVLKQVPEDALRLAVLRLGGAGQIHVLEH